MTKCSVDLSCNSKLLLKVLTCLWSQYVKGHIQYTQIYQAAPSEEGYDLMLAELNARFDAIVSSYVLEKLNVCNTQEPSYVELVVSDAYGNVVYYNSDVPEPINDNDNSFQNAASNSIASFNLGTTKPVQRLNNDECLENAYQVNPVYLADGSGNYSSATAASVVVRTGCAGIANDGFIRLSVIVDNACFPVPSCVKEACCNL
jgi:hypothetical protein